MVFCFYSRLALYVYEYLLHVGAQKAAQTFLSEVSTCSVVASGSGGSAGVAGLTSGTHVVPGGLCKLKTLQIIRLIIEFCIKLFRNYI